jgi:hypothetical protein
MLLSDLPIGTKVADVNSKYNNKIIIWTVASKNHYGNNQVTLISDVLALKPSDAKESGNSNSRNTYGNNRYSLSNIHSWLNSNKANWYEAKHSLDAPPSSSLVSANPYDTEKGFCTNLSSKFLNKIKTTTITTAIPTCDGGGSETISCKFFLPSLMEVGLGQENGISEGSQFPLFTDNASRIIEFGGASREWGLRTPASNNGYDFRHIRPNGTNYTNVANNGYIGIRTVCNIDSNIEVENKSSYYELKLSNYLNENASLSSALSVLENKKEITKQLRTNLYNILNDKGVEVKEDYTLTALINEVKDVSNVNVKVYNKLPSVVENGQIAIVTDTCNNITVTYDYPSSPLLNDVFVRITDKNQCKFEVGTNKKIEVYVFGAWKYNGSTWDRIDSYIGIDNVWFPMNKEILFENGNGLVYEKYFKTRKSWANGNTNTGEITFTNDYIYMKDDLSYMTKSNYSHIKSKSIDFKDINYVYIDYEVKDRWNAEQYIMAGTVKYSITNRTVKRNVLTLDMRNYNEVSDITFYMGYSSGGSAYTDIKIYNIWCE